jgi:hypothetical protein
MNGSNDDHHQGVLKEDYGDKLLNRRGTDVRARSSAYATLPGR